MQPTPTWKTITFWIHVVLWLASVGSAVAEVLPPEWAALVAALVTGSYAIARALQKIAAGESLKKLLSTTEAWVAGVTILSSILTASVGLLPGQYAVLVASIAALMVKVARVLQSSSADAPPGPPAAAVLVLLAGLLLGSTALAQGPSPDRDFGGCFRNGSVCLGPSAAITLGQYNLTTGKFSGGVIPGAGYGVVVAADQWYQTGLALYLSFRAGGGEPNQAIPSVVLSFADYVRVGGGVALTEALSGPATRQWLITFGFGKDFGGPGPVKAYRAKRVVAP